MLLIAIGLYAKPFIRDFQNLTVLVFAVIAILLQVLVIDKYLVPEISTIWQGVERNGTIFDKEFDDLTNRLEEIESAFNVSI